MARFIEFTTTDGNRQALGEKVVINAEYITRFYTEDKEHTTITVIEDNNAWEVTVAESYEEVKVMLDVEQD